MTIQRDDGSWNIGNIAALIICLPVVGWLLVFSVTIYQIPDRIIALETKVDADIKQTNRNADDLHIIKQVLHLDGGYTMTTNVFKIVGQSTYIKNN